MFEKKAARTWEEGGKRKRNEQGRAVKTPTSDCEGAYLRQRKEDKDEVRSLNRAVRARKEKVVREGTAVVGKGSQRAWKMLVVLKVV